MYLSIIRIENLKISFQEKNMHVKFTKSKLLCKEFTLPFPNIFISDLT